ncbi:MAG: 2-C-methyl-D-erythritol 4-phosphate cytidylyltransferase [Nitrospirota bacterium]
MKANVVAVVPAAGLGKRLGPGTNKPFLRILDKPIIVWTLEALSSVSEISEIIPVFKESDMESGVALCERYRLSKVKRIAPGGKERQDSVYNGLRLLHGDTDIVVIHDGVRPVIDSRLVKDAITNLEGFDGVIVGVPVKDTIKEIEGVSVKKTIKRGSLWSIQTPQVFRYSRIMEAYVRAMEEGFYSTDDSALMERTGSRIKIVMGSYDNIKVTTPDDIPVAEMLLKKRPGFRG